MLRSLGRFVWRTFVALLVLVVLTAVGIVAALGLIATDDVQIAVLDKLERRDLDTLMQTSPDLPYPLNRLVEANTVDPKAVTPLNEMGLMNGPNRFKRQSWVNVDHEVRPSDPKSDPLQGTTRLMFFERAQEMELATAFHRANLPNRVLRVGVGDSPPLKHSAKNKSLGIGGGRRICLVEIYAGNPISRSGVEETADRVIALVFGLVKQVDEVDVVAVPWRTVTGHKPPTWFSVSALRAAYLPIAGVRSHGDNLRSCGAVWSDDRVMSDVPVR